MAAFQIEELGHPNYTDRMKGQWRTAPTSMIVVEYLGAGGSTDDRPLCDRGTIAALTSIEPAARFATIEEAAAAAQRIPNRRKGSILGVVPSWE